jgi:hypothetical protein
VPFPAPELDLPQLGQDDGQHAQVGTHGFGDGTRTTQRTREDRVESERGEIRHGLDCLSKAIDGQGCIVAALDSAFLIPGCFGVTYEIDGFHAGPLDLWLLIMDIMWTKSWFEKGATL